MPHEQTITVNLDPETYEEVATGGRWFNLPSVHPYNGQVFETQAHAIDFATDQGYLGFGYGSVKDAEGAARYRANSQQESIDEQFEAGNQVAPIPPDVSDVPFNPGGRAIDGFQYPELDQILIHTGRGTAGPVLNPLKTINPKHIEKQATKFALDAFSKTLSGLMIGDIDRTSPRAPGSETSFAFETILLDGRRSVRFSDNPKQLQGERPLD